MKKILTVILMAIIWLPVKAQINDTIGLNIPFKDGKLIYENVVTVDGKSQSDLYKNARQWFVDYFVSSKDVIQNEDKEDGLIVGKGILLLAMKYNFAYGRNWNDRVTIQINCKDGKYRYRIYDMIMTIPSEDLGSYGTQSARDVTDQEVINKLIGLKPSATLTKNMCVKIMTEINVEIAKTIQSLNKAMTSKVDNF